MPNDDELNGQTTIISKSIKDILEFTFNREMKMKCFELLQVDNTYDFSEELKTRLIRTVPGHHYGYYNNSSNSQQSSRIISLSQPSSRISTDRQENSRISRSQPCSSSSTSQHTSRISTVILSSCISFSQHPRRISSSQPSNRISTHTQDSGSSSRSQPCSISLAPQQASRSSASQYSIPYRDSNIGDDVDVSGSNDESSDLSSTSCEKTVSDALLKSDHQIMAEFLQDIQMLENL
ncbi:hypothetical protein M8J77_004480 [Diaphorina citri]|nr:hypothetical protein M8J77_004480 [Diaphorina citri]